MSGKRQLELWGDESPETATEQQAKPIELKRSEVGQSARELFVNPERQIDFHGVPHHEWSPPNHDRDTITVDRIRDNVDGPAHRFAIKRHDYVEVLFDSGKVDYGTAVGISHARQEVRVRFSDEQKAAWFSIGCIYPAIDPFNPRSKDQARSEEIKAIAQTVNERIATKQRYTSLKCVSLVRIGSMEGRPKITSTKEAVAFFKQYWEECPGNDQERFIIACLDTKHRCLTPNRFCHY